jgi:AraC-like DNA-binding protein
MSTNPLFIKPGISIQSFVSQIVVVEKQVKNNIVTPLPYYADGLPGIVYQQARGGMYLNSTDTPLPGFFLYGQTVKPVTVLAYGSFRMIIFYLYPYSVSSLFGIRCSEITDSCLELGLFPGTDLKHTIQRLQDAGAIGQQVDIISKFIYEKSCSMSVKGDDVVQSALAHIIENNGLGSLVELRKNLHITERTFERRFEQYVGVSPKLFSRIVQFKSSLDQLQKTSFSRLSDLAYKNGYADQSHFIRSFKEFTGFNPLQYVKEVGKYQKEKIAD